MVITCDIMMLNEDQIKRLKLLNKNWAKINENDRTVEVQQILHEINDEPIRAWKTIEMCPKLGPSILSSGPLIQASLSGIEQYKRCESEWRIPHLISCLKIIIQLLSSHGTDLPFLTSERKRQLLEIIEDDETTIEAALIAGTTLVRWMIFTRESHERSAERILEIFIELQDRKFARIVLIDGILNCGNPTILLADSHLFSKVFQFIIQICQSSALQTYQGFQALRLFTSRVKYLAEIRDKLSQEERKLLEENFQMNGKMCQEVIKVAEANWENPLKGVPDIMTDAFENLVDTMALVEDSQQFEFDLQSILQTNITQLDWKTKSKYPTLQILIPRMDVRYIFEAFPDFGHGLATCLSSNHIASSGTSVYKALLKQLNLDLWSRTFLRVFEDVLMSVENPLQVTNLRNHWLVPTLNSISGSGSTIQSALWNRVHNLPLECEDKNVNALATIFHVMKIERQCGFKEDLNDQDISTLSNGLFHENTLVRSSAFSVLCHLKKRGVAPKLREICLVNDFILSNLCVDSSSFRQVFLSDTTVLLIRCRDYLVLKHRKGQFDEFCRNLIQHLDDLMGTLFSNLFPGANYQRQITSLELLRLIREFFFTFSDNKGLNKWSGNGNPKNLVSYCNQEFRLMNFTSIKNFRHLLTSTLFYMCDVRELAESLLLEFRPSLEEIKIVTRKGFQLLCGAKFSQCESGSTLIHLVQHWLREMKIPISDLDEMWLENDESLKFLDRAKPLRNDSIAMSQCLSIMYTNLLGEADANFIALSRECPMHGILTALRLTIEADFEMLDKSWTDELVDILAESVEFMLAKLSLEEKENASFADMSAAIEAMIGESDKSVEITEQHQLVLACAWLNIKESALLSAKLATIAKLDSEQSKGIFLSPETASRCGDIMMTILTKCRHKGAMEATNLALKDYCKAMMESNSSQYNSIPENILLRVLEQVSTFSASVTRRSAGLPMIVQSIVSSEPRGKCRKLLGIACAKLIRIASNESPDILSDDAFETKDDPRSHALHILRGLVHDSSLSHDIAPYISSILVACINQFHSTIWSVRNASLQLFGALMPRILGQKKVRDDESVHNSITVYEFFTRFGNVVPLILNRLEDQSSTKELTNPALIPLLSMLSKVSPGKIYDDPEHNRLIAQFKSTLFRLLKNCVINVRKLAGKAFASFTADQEVPQNTKLIMKRLAHEKLKANFQNGLLYCLQELLKRSRGLSNDLFEHHEICVKGSFNRLILTDILDSCGVNSAISNSESHDYSYDPGLMQLKQRHQLEDDDHSRFIHQLSKAKDSNELTSLMWEEIEERFEKLKDEMVQTFYEKVVQFRKDFYTHQESAMDLLIICTEKLAVCSNKFGLTTKTYSLLPMAIAYCSMMLQDDFEMFFREDSPYVALFGEFVDQVRNASEPNGIETTRMNSALAIKNLAPVFRNRQISGFNPLLQHCFVTLANAALLLMSDEDPEIRHCATSFVNDFRCDENNRISTFFAKRKLVKFGLENFTHAIEWFDPFIKVFFQPWQVDNAKTFHFMKERQYLFESGEGVNVYAEKTGDVLVYAEVLEEWLKTQPKIVKLDLNPKKVVDKAAEILEILEEKQESDKIIHFRILENNDGYKVLVALKKLLHLMRSFHSVLFGESLSETIMTQQLSTAEARLSRFI